MKRFVFFLAIFVCFSSAIFAQNIAFTNVNVIPLDRVRVLDNLSVLLRNGIIEELWELVVVA